MSSYVDWVIQEYRHEGIIVDSNVLLLLIVGSIDLDLVGRFKRTETYSRSDYHQIRGILDRFPRVYSLQPVLTEVSNLLGQLSETSAQECRRGIIQWIDATAEIQLHSYEIARLVEFPRFGLADTALIYLASRGSVVLTDDFRLSGYVERLGAPVMNVSHIRGSRWIS